MNSAESVTFPSRGSVKAGAARRQQQAFHPEPPGTNQWIGYAGFVELVTLQPGSTAPSLPGIDFSAGPTVLFFYKVTCPVCQMAAPPVSRFERAFPGRIRGIGQDPQEKLADFESAYALGFPSIPDLPPYEVSNAYGIRTVPTTFLVDSDSSILDTVESWDRDGLNRVSKELAALVGADFAQISEPGDGLPPFRPG
jgi:thiol-disulfide isomerase/thioredoxin